jgi:type II secretory pathway pseudopilin PulG
MELLIVIVILGVLATVTVFAVRGITDTADENACEVELVILQKAEEVHRVTNGMYANEATLVASGTISSNSAMYDVTVSGDSYEVDSAGDCTGPASGGTPTAPTPPTAVTMPTSSFAWHGGVTAWRFGADANGDDEIVVLGREQGKADWVAATNAGAASTRRVHFVDLDSLNAGNIAVFLALINSNGDTALGVYRADDTLPLPGSGAADVYDYLVSTVGGYPNTTLVSMASGDLQTTFATFP